MNLKDRLSERKQIIENNDYNKILSDNKIPSFGPLVYQKITEKKKKKRKIIRKTVLITLIIVFISTAALIYLPQFFITSETKNEFISSVQVDSLTLRSDYLKSNENMDFDNDGLTNGNEMKVGSDPYNIDSDSDGIIDGNDEAPTERCDKVYEVLSAQNIEVGSSFEMNDVIMWADDKESLINGGVIKNIAGGYRFSDFSGWVKLPQSGTAYKYENGVHTKLKYKEHENAWYVDGTCNVIVAEENPEMVYQYTFFGTKGYIKGTFGKVISFLLPEKGFITCKEMWLNDTFINIGKYFTTDNLNLSYDKNDCSRFSSNDNSLKSLMHIYYSIDSESAVLVSLMSKEYGESVLIVYGYTYEGHLMVSTLDGNNHGIISVHPTARKQLSKDNSIICYEYYEFYGCGYDSQKGDTICFFAGAVRDSDEGANNSGNNSEADSTDTSNEESFDCSDNDSPVVPKNGKYTENGTTLYYINGLPVVNDFIRINEDGLYEKCTLQDIGAFYLDKQGQKTEDWTVIDENIYVYNGNGYFHNQFFTLKDGAYIESTVAESDAMFCDHTGKLVSGWFRFNGNSYYASPTNNIILKKCFVRNDNGSIKYLDRNGRMATNKLVNIEGVDILLDASGSIINYENVKRIVNKYLKE